MTITKNPAWWIITVPETENNSSFRYAIPVVTDGPERLGRAMKRIARRVAVRAFAMENFFKTLPADWDGYWRENTESPFDKWTERNRLDWNEYFHTGMKVLEAEAWALWREYKDWHFAKYGWNAY